MCARGVVHARVHRSPAVARLDDVELGTECLCDLVVHLRVVRPLAGWRPCRERAQLRRIGNRAVVGNERVFVRGEIAWHIAIGNAPFRVRLPSDQEHRDLRRRGFHERGLDHLVFGVYGELRAEIRGKPRQFDLARKRS